MLFLFTASLNVRYSVSDVSKCNHAWGIWILTIIYSCWYTFPLYHIISHCYTLVFFLNRYMNNAFVSRVFCWFLFRIFCVGDSENCSSVLIHVYSYNHAFACACRVWVFGVNASDVGLMVTFYQNIYTYINLCKFGIIFLVTRSNIDDPIWYL